MRAKISHTHGLSDESRGIFHTERSAAAVSEARAILAETEPAPSRETLQSIPLGLLPKVSYPILGAAEALAESLSAFVED